MDKKQEKKATGNRILGRTNQNKPQRTRRAEPYPGRRRCGSSTNKIWKQRCFEGFFHDSASQHKKLPLM